MILRFWIIVLIYWSKDTSRMVTNHPLDKKALYVYKGLQFAHNKAYNKDLSKDNIRLCFSKDL